LPLVIQLLKRVKFGVKRVAVNNHPRVGVLLQGTLQSPFTVHKAEVAELIGALVAHGAGEIVDLILKLEDSVPSINYEEPLECLAVTIETVAEPAEAVLHFAVPGRIILPLHLVHVSKPIELEVDAEGHGLLHLWVLELQIHDERECPVGLLHLVVLFQVLVNAVEFVERRFLLAPVLLLLVFVPVVFRLAFGLVAEAESVHDVFEEECVLLQLGFTEKQEELTVGRNHRLVRLLNERLQIVSTHGTVHEYFDGDLFSLVTILVVIDQVYLQVCEALGKPQLKFGVGPNDMSVALGIRCRRHLCIS
jgi:hypothetical protein